MMILMSLTKRSRNYYLPSMESMENLLMYNQEKLKIIDIFGLTLFRNFLLIFITLPYFIISLYCI